MSPWSGRHVVITGVGRPGQVGEVVAETFAALGAVLILIDRDGEAVSTRVRALGERGFSAHGITCDLTDASAVANAAEQVARLAPNGVQALLCLAGGFAPGSVADAPVDLWQRMLAINLTTAVLATRALVPLLRLAKGAIVYVTAAGALPGGRLADIAPYGVAKAGVLALMQAVAQEERKAGVRANALAPTAIQTATNVAAMGDSTNYVSRETVAQWMVTLASPEHAAVTGQVVRLG